MKNNKYIHNKISIYDIAKAYKNDPYVIKILKGNILEYKTRIKYLDQKIKDISLELKSISICKEEYYLYLTFISLSNPEFQDFETYNYRLAQNVKTLFLIKNNNSKISNSYISKDIIFNVLGKDIVYICKQLGIEVFKSGKYYIALCPFHQEKTPSFTIYRDTNSFYCFGCNVGGDNITLLKKVQDLTFKDAVELLSKF